MKLTIAHFCPELLNMYGDRGNITVLKKRLEWRGLDADVLEIPCGQPVDFSNIDIFYLGGGGERQTREASEYLAKQKEGFAAYIEDGGVTLAVCGGYHMLGSAGLGLLPFTLESARHKMIGNIAVSFGDLERPVVGFENHETAVKLGNLTSFGKVRFGFGNSPHTGKEGVRTINLYGTHLHGPILPKNPHFADFLLSQALIRRYPDFEGLRPLDDVLEWEANEFIMLNRGKK